MNEPQIIRPIDAARILNVGLPRIYAAIHRGSLPTYGPGNRYVLLEEVRRYVEQRNTHVGFAEPKRKPKSA